MNPLMQSMGFQGGGMPSLANIFGMLKSGNPEQIAVSLMQRNPQFKAFIDSNKGKSPEQVAQQYGIDINQIMRQFG